MLSQEESRGAPSSISVVVAVPPGMGFTPKNVEAFCSQLDLSSGDEVLVEEGADGALVPRLWAHGIERARGDIVALTLASMRPDPGWAAAVRGAMGSGVTGVGGAIEPAPDLSALGLAIHFCRYWRYLLPFERAPADGLPGDNCAYRRTALGPCRALWADGFWETEVDAALRSQGARFEVDPSIVVRQGLSLGFADFCRNRFRHGLRSGQWRARGLSVAGRAGRVLVAPLVPAVLFLRIARQLARRHLGAALFRAAPHLLVFLSFWAAGEAVGTLRRGRASSRAEGAE